MWVGVVLQQDQCGSLPGLIFWQFCDELRGASSEKVERSCDSNASWRREIAQVFVSCVELKLQGHEARLVVGAAADDTGKVLDTFLAGVGGFGGGDTIRNVADERSMFAFGGGGDSEIGVAAEDGLDLDEVNAARR